MHIDAVRDIYDRTYADTYDARFVHSAWARSGFDAEVAFLTDLVRPDGRWLDVGCGTGYLLSRFPGQPRAGLDVSPAMLERAKEANPDAIFLRQGDMRDEVPEWEAAWTLITCTWTAYNYLDTVTEVEQLLERFARWTAPGGSCFVPVMDLEDLRPFTVVPYAEDIDVFGGELAVTSVTWTWVDPLDGRLHRHLVAPQVGHFVALLSRWYRRVEVVRYPPANPGGVARKAVLASDRRAVGDDRPVMVVGVEDREPVTPLSLAEPSEAPDLDVLPATYVLSAAVRRFAPRRFLRGVVRRMKARRR